MNEMIERVAKAICRAGICGPKNHVENQVEGNWRKFEAEAKAAILAMREPTQGMLFVGSNDEAGYTRNNLLESWQLMIDEALK